MKSLKWLMTLIPLIFLTGCWSKIEVDEQVFVFAMYVDKGQKPGTVAVTISSPLPNRLTSGQQAGSGGGSGKPYAMISKSADTVSDAFRELQKDLTRRLNFGHTREVIIGKDYAEAGIGDLLDWMDKEPSFHISSFLAVAPAKAREVAELNPLYEQMPAEVLRKMNLQHTMFSTSVRECLIAHYSKVGYATNLMFIGEEPIPSENEQHEKWAGIQGAALFHDDQLKGTLGTEEARALAWAAGRLGRMAFSVTWDDGSSRASVLFNVLKSNKNVKMTPDGPKFTINLKGSGNLIYKKDTKQRSDTEITDIITKLLKSMIEKDLNSALDMTRNFGSDALQLGLLLEWKYPGYWKNIREDWPEYYKTHSEIEVKAKVDVTNITNEP